LEFGQSLGYKKREALVLNVGSAVCCVFAENEQQRPLQHHGDEDSTSQNQDSNHMERVCAVPRLSRLLQGAPCICAAEFGLVVRFVQSAMVCLTTPPPTLKHA
jgi:hypothetical protein